MDPTAESGRSTSVIGLTQSRLQLNLNGPWRCRLRPIGTSSIDTCRSNTIVIGPTHTVTSNSYCLLRPTQPPTVRSLLQPTDKSLSITSTSYITPHRLMVKTYNIRLRR